jgi:hypothetical protein
MGNSLKILPLHRQPMFFVTTTAMKSNQRLLQEETISPSKIQSIL